MDRVWEFQGTTFTWNIDKADSNRIHHGVDFEEAATRKERQIYDQ